MREGVFGNAVLAKNVVHFVYERPGNGVGLRVAVARNNDEDLI